MAAPASPFAAGAGVVAPLQTVLGIDPGSRSGAWAILGPAGLVAGDLPVVDGNIDAAALARLVRATEPTRAIVERVSAMPKQGVTSVFSFGAAYGIILGVLGAAGVPVTLVPPTKWKRAFSLDSDKEKSRALAIRTWPTCTQFSRKKDNGRAEAALLAKWGQEHA